MTSFARLDVFCSASNNADPKKDDCLGAVDPKTGKVTPLVDSHGKQVRVPAGVDIDANARLAAVLGPQLRDVSGASDPIANNLTGIAVSASVFKSYVTYGGPWDYKTVTRDERFAPFGNYHYGFVGSEWGWRGSVLLAEAGRAQQSRYEQTGQAGHKGDGGWPGIPYLPEISGKAPYGDFVEDQTLIQMGVDSSNANLKHVRVPCKD
ncbi:MAG: hypothetical protein H7A44_02565 [Opitutaceae bacterium]|nr:hypothetical protein [Cephaloticoccus sp.]MCP5529299.1 hypothetical protein [Opitutaceae bacterium]